MKNFGKWCAFGLFAVVALEAGDIGVRLMRLGDWIDSCLVVLASFGLWSLAYSIVPPREVVVIVRNGGNVDVQAYGKMFRASGGEGV